jgi:L-lactate dehydrogenase complex protein LldG
MDTLLEETTSSPTSPLWDLFEAKATALGATVLRFADEADADRAVGAAPTDFVCRADFAVAETGSVVVSVPQADRAAALIADHLWLRVRSGDVVANLDDALRRIGASIAAGSRYVTFMSGPSRTADIERTLTIGVHGPRALTVVVIGEIS